jgi:hypothetical protein
MNQNPGLFAPLSEFPSAGQVRACDHAGFCSGVILMKLLWTNLVFIE